ncbi:FHA domain-containing protein [Streptomyces sp. NPDC050738]|uniref:FHA domain-containing protein n=1 Tax=Streptomyces sp. NPDC050738 TaxID=3154744 RepID=UPI003434E6C1
MQIRLTVLAPRSGQPSNEVRSCNVLVTAPAGTALAAVTSGLAAAVAGAEAGAEAGRSGAVVLYAGHRRLDVQQCALGEPPLVDGAVLSLQIPAEDDGAAARGDEDTAAQLHVVAGPDAGGVHLLHGGQIRIGRSADADVPLDDPDVSRLHCAVTVGDDGRVTVADLGSTNGTTVDGREIGGRPVRLAPGALLRIGESALRIASGTGGPAAGAAAAVVPDGEGHLRVSSAVAEAHADAGSDSRVNTAAAEGTSGYGGTAPAPVRDPYSTPHPGTRPSGRVGTPPRGTRMPLRDDDIDEHARAESEGDTEAGPGGARRRGGIGTWARRLTGGRTESVRESPPAQGPPTGAPDASPVRLPESWPDPAALLLTALGPGARLWERGPGHPESLVVRLGTADRAEMASVPVTVSLREAGSLGLAGPRERLAGLARAVVAQLAALHSPAGLEIVLISTDRGRSAAERTADWGWLGWLPHLRPAHGQDCRLLLAYDREQASARTDELVRRLDYGPLGTSWASADARSIDAAAQNYDGPRTVVVVDGDPGSAVLRETTARLASAGAAAGIHLLCLAETPAASALSPVDATYETACAASLAFRECGAVALLSGDVATTLRLLRTAGGQPAGHGTLAAVDAVSAAWAERFGRALAPLRADGSGGGGESSARQAAALPQSARLLDELGLARATPASLMARWASAADGKEASEGAGGPHRTPEGGSATPGARALAVLGAGPRGPLTVDLAAEGPHLLIEGPAGSGRTELLRAAAASLAAAARPDRLGLILVDGSGGDGLSPCTELPHTSTHLVASDPVRMREFAQSLGGELKRRAELLGSIGFAEWHTQREVTERMIGQRTGSGSPAGRRVGGVGGGAGSGSGTGGDEAAAWAAAPRVGPPGRPGDIESADSGTLRLRGRIARADAAAATDGASQPPPPLPLPRLVVLVDDFDALVAPALGSPGRPAAGSVVRALEAVARDGERLGVHLIATSARPDRTADTELAHIARLRVVLDPAPVSPGPEDPSPGRGRLGHPDGRVTPFQGGRVTGRIPRTATLRPTVVPLEWERMGDPPTRRPVRELGNGPTDLALLASALDRAARSVEAVPIPPLVC